MLSEARIHAAGHDVADTNIVLAQVLHDRFAEPIQSKLGSIVSRPAFERVLPGQAGDIDDVSTTTLLKVWNGGVAAVEHTRKVRIDHLPPLFWSHSANV